MLFSCKTGSKRCWCNSPFGCSVFHYLQTRFPLQQSEQQTPSFLSFFLLQNTEDKADFHKAFPKSFRAFFSEKYACKKRTIFPSQSSTVSRFSQLSHSPCWPRCNSVQVESKPKQMPTTYCFQRNIPDSDRIRTGKVVIVLSPFRQAFRPRFIRAETHTSI